MSPPRRLKRKRRKRWLFAIFWALLVLAGGTALSLHLFLDPERLRALAKEAVGPAIRGRLEFAGAFSIDWWNLGVAATDIVLEGPDGGQILRAKRVAIAPRIGALLSGRLELREVILDGPLIRLERRGDGSWNLLEAFRPEAFPQASAGAARRFPSIRLRGGRLSLRDERGTATAAQAPAPLDLEVTDISFRVWEARGTMRFEGEFRHPFIQRLRASGTIDPARGAIEGVVTASKLDLSSPIDRFFGEAAARALRSLNLQGFADISEARLLWDPETGVHPVTIVGRLIRCQVAPEGFPFPLKQVAGSFALRGRVLEIQALDGFFGAGAIQVRGIPTHPGAGPAAARIEIDSARGVYRVENLLVKAESIPIDHRFRSIIGPGASEVFDQLGPQGSVGVEVRMSTAAFPPTKDEIEATVTFNGVDAAYRGFPYHFYGIQGEAVLRGGHLVLGQNLKARNRDLTMAISGQLDLSGLFPLRTPAAAVPREGRPKVGEIYVEVRAENVPVDEELREAIPPEIRKLYDDFRPSGQGQVTVTLRKGEEEFDLSTAIFIQGQGIRISYAGFPYEVTGITGPASIDLTRKLVTLAGLRGRHGTQLITGEGVVTLGQPETIRIDLRCDDLEVDEDLKAAMTPETRKLLEDFRFQGRARTEVTIHSVPDGSMGVKVEVDLLQGQVEYALFPYPLALAGGHLTAIGAHTLRFTDVVTRERRPDGASERPRLLFNGGIGAASGDRLLDFHFDITDLAVDDRLMNALPLDLKQFVRGLGLQGTFQGELAGSFSYPMDRPERSRLIYQARNVKAQDAGVDFGLQLRRMEGMGGFEGGRDEEGNHFFDGNVQVKTTAFNRITLKDADISFAFGREHPALTKVREGRPAGKGEYLPPATLVSRLTGKRLRSCFQMQVRKCDLYGGMVQGFLAIDTGREKTFEGQFAGEGVQVARAAPEVFGATEEGVSGEARGSVSFSGITGDSLSVKGSGEGRIERARLASLPILGFLNILYGEFSLQNYFNDVSLRFGIRDGRFHAPTPDGIAIRSRGVDLKGGGTMDFNGKLDLVLNPEFIGLKIPLVDQMVGLLKKSLVQVWITGEITRPQRILATGAGMIQIPLGGPSKRPGDRPLPRELRQTPAGGAPLPPPPPPQVPDKQDKEN